MADLAPAIAVITWTSGQLRCSVARLSGQVQAGYEIPALAAVVLSVPAPFQRGVGSAVTVPAPGGGRVASADGRVARQALGSLGIKVLMNAIEIA